MKTKEEKVDNLLAALEVIALNAMYYKMNRVSKEPGVAQKAADDWNKFLRELKCSLIDVVEPNEEQADAMKERVKDETYR